MQNESCAEAQAGAEAGDFGQPYAADSIRRAR
jgi:hypothetical protein